MRKRADKVIPPTHTPSPRPLLPTGVTWSSASASDSPLGTLWGKLEGWGVFPWPLSSRFMKSYNCISCYGAAGKLFWVPRVATIVCLAVCSLHSPQQTLRPALQLS